ncbi:MAG: 1-phosphofructokinase [bacterium]|nr:1-phosphofructokinase [bacterium]
MIYTVTLNPSLDYIVSVDDFRPGRTNRTESEVLAPGGKGINVSAVLKNLGFDSIALGFTAGFTGEEIVRRLQETGIKSEMIHLRDGFSRINFKLKSVEGTEVNGRGPEIRGEDREALMRRLRKLQDGDVLFLSGSAPASVPDGIYRDILAGLRDRRLQTVVDATKNLLLKTLEYRPFLIKPNHHEVGELFDVELPPDDSVIPYGKKLQEMGARNVLISMAGEGAVLIAEDGAVYRAFVPKGELKNSVGAGDSMAAGFLAGWLEKGDYLHALSMGVAAGSASAYSDGFAGADEIRELYTEVKAGRIQ